MSKKSTPAMIVPAPTRESWIEPPAPEPADNGFQKPLNVECQMLIDGLRASVEKIHGLLQSHDDRAKANGFVRPPAPLVESINALLVLILRHVDAALQRRQFYLLLDRATKFATELSAVGGGDAPSWHVHGHFCGSDLRLQLDGLIDTVRETCLLVKPTVMYKHALESLNALNQQQVNPENICQIYGWVDEDGIGDRFKLRRADDGELEPPKFAWREREDRRSKLFPFTPPKVGGLVDVASQLRLWMSDDEPADEPVAEADQGEEDFGDDDDAYLGEEE